MSILLRSSEVLTKRDGELFLKPQRPLIYQATTRSLLPHTLPVAPLVLVTPFARVDAVINASRLRLQLDSSSVTSALFRVGRFFQPRQLADRQG
jgi:hypothetical protein